MAAYPKVEEARAVLERYNKGQLIALMKHMGKLYMGPDNDPEADEIINGALKNYTYSVEVADSITRFIEANDPDDDDLEHIEEQMDESESEAETIRILRANMGFFLLDDLLKQHMDALKSFFEGRDLDSLHMLLELWEVEVDPDGEAENEEEAHEVALTQIFAVARDTNMSVNDILDDYTQTMDSVPSPFKNVETLAVDIMLESLSDYDLGQLYWAMMKDSIQREPLGRERMIKTLMDYDRTLLLNYLCGYIRGLQVGRRS